ncbi:Hsp70 protein [Hokovirus HKV1]|uniref:Hsp70 protein n=1 Tax=Hokovirus HKV1 TaxID=1977638 RepID=A0A1V0SGQ6_9VIRU|nr:Hsp70 protein [Hokovirus HKV1]
MDNFDIDDYFNEKQEVNEENEIIECLGIDLGTTNSCVGVWDQKTNSVNIIGEDDNKTIPSYVSFINSKRYVGHYAKNNKELNPNNTIYEVKRIVGKDYDDEMVQLDKKFLSYKIIKNETKQNNNILIELNNLTKTPEEIMAHILTKLKNLASKVTSTNKAVITVPAHFNNTQRAATQNAAAMAGLECIKIINEPTAAACAYGLETIANNNDIIMNIIVYDFGGGTLDVSLLNISYGIIECVACSGNTHLGGADFDMAIMNYCLDYFNGVNDLNITLENLPPVIIQKLKKKSERAKIALSEKSSVDIKIDNFYLDNDLSINITKTEFETMCSDLLLLTMKPVYDVLNDSELSIDDINEIILVGGSTKMPAIKNNIKTFFKNKKINDTINPDLTVAIGAAIHGFNVCNPKSKLANDVTLLDINSMSLGIELIDGLMDVIVPRNTIIPISKKRKYTTTENMQKYVKIKIFEGERSMTENNFFIGEFVLEIDEEPMGMPEIEITFTIDANNIISVQAIDLKKNSKKSIVVKSNTSNLTKEEINKYIDDSINYQKQDKKLENKKKYYWEILTMCENIKENIKNLTLSNQEEINKILLFVENTIISVKKQDYNKHKLQWYQQLYNTLFKDYGTLVLKYKENLEYDTNVEQKGTLIYGDEETKIYGDEVEETKIEKDNKKNKSLNNSKKELINLCNNILSILLDTNNPINIDSEDHEYLKNYVNDTLLWVYGYTNLLEQDFIDKIDQVNELCDKIMSKYE